jgi:hypothetical protein
MKFFWEFFEDGIVNHGNLKGNKYGGKITFFWYIMFWPYKGKWRSYFGDIVVKFVTS